jgi:hypothetical protein
LGNGSDGGGYNYVILDITIYNPYIFAGSNFAILIAGVFYVISFGWLS